MLKYLLQPRSGALKRTLGIKVDLQEDYFQVSLPDQFLPAGRRMWGMLKINLCAGDGSPTPPDTPVFIILTFSLSRFTSMADRRSVDFICFYLRTSCW